jgi:hypothetical protein
MPCGGMPGPAPCGGWFGILGTIGMFIGGAPGSGVPAPGMPGGANGGGIGWPCWGMGGGPPGGGIIGGCIGSVGLDWEGACCGICGGGCAMFISAAAMPLRPWSTLLE